MKLVFQFSEGLHVGVTWSGYSEIATNRRIQHPERQLQKPIGMNILRTAVRHRDAALDQRGMHFHSTTEPRMPRVPDFSDFPNMGVVLMTCITNRERTSPWKRMRRNRGRCSHPRWGPWWRRRKSAASTTATNAGRRENTGAGQFLLWDTCVTRGGSHQCQPKTGQQRGHRRPVAAQPIPAPPASPHPRQSFSSSRIVLGH